MRASAQSGSAARRTAASSSRPTRGAIRARDVFVATNGYTDGVVPVAPPPDHPDRLVHHRVRAACRRTLAHELSPKGRAFFDTKNFLYYWHVSADRRMVFGGRASFMPTSIDKTARDPVAAACSRSIRSWPDYRIEYAWGGNVGFTFDRMPHVGRTKDGVTYAMGCCGTGVALMTNLGTQVGAVAGGRRGAGPHASAIPARAGAVRGPAVVPAVRRGVVPPAGPARRADPAE